MIDVEKKKFPDGEVYVRVPVQVNDEEVLVIHTGFPDQNDRVMEALLLLDALKDLGASKTVLVMSYVPYARQDRRFREGEPISIKTLFEAFNYWTQGPNAFHIEYHARSAGAPMENEETLLQKINLNFHDIANPANDPVLNKKAFYIRSAYRNESTFTTNNLGNADDILNNSQRPERLIYQEQRVSENYKHMVAETVKALYSNDPEIQQKNVGELADELIGEVRDAMRKVFDDLVLEGPGNPLTGGTFRFRKGA